MPTSPSINPSEARRQADAALKKLFGELSAPLGEIENRISASAIEFEPELREFIAYIAGSQGKRLRPALVLLSAECTGGITPPHQDLAVVLELIHIATLVHDDIMDGATIRRGRPTANIKWGSAISVLLGDSLFAHALMLSTQFEDREVTRHIAHAANQVCAGEIIQTRRRFDLELGLAEYFRIIEMKTATLFEAASRLAARINLSDGPQIEALGLFGSKLGIAYQIYDDCLDIAGDEGSALKSLGTDFAKGKLTLPLLIALKETPPDQREHISTLIIKADPKDSDNIRSIISSSGALLAAANSGKRFIDEGIEALEAIKDSPSKSRLLTIADCIRLLLSDLGSGGSGARDPVAKAA